MRREFFLSFYRPLRIFGLFTTLYYFNGIFLSANPTSGRVTVSLSGLGCEVKRIKRLPLAAYLTLLPLRGVAPILPFGEVVSYGRRDFSANFLLIDGANVVFPVGSTELLLQ